MFLYRCLLWSIETCDIYSGSALGKDICSTMRSEEAGQPTSEFRVSNALQGIDDDIVAFCSVEHKPTDLLCL
jgi:hypothetical protein